MTGGAGGVGKRIAKVVTAEAPAAPFRRSAGRASYPRRITLDLDDARYDWLRRAAYDARVPAATLLRAAIDLTQGNEKLLQQIIELAVQEVPPP